MVVLRRHPWSFFWPSLKIALLMLVPWLVFMLGGFGAVFTWTTVVICGLSVVFGLFLLCLWNSNIVIVTNQRVMVINLPTPINRKVTEVPLTNIQDISFESAGILETIFGFGDVLLQTAGSKSNDIILKDLEAPYDVQQLISEAMKKQKAHF